MRQRRDDRNPVTDVRRPKAIRGEGFHRHPGERMVSKCWSREQCYDARQYYFIHRLFYASQVGVAGLTIDEFAVVSAE